MKNNNYTFNVRIKDKNATEYYHKGKTYIEGRKNSEYELAFTNHTSRRVLVIFSVDGLSVMDGKVASDKSQGYVVDAYKSLIVPGWTINNDKVAKFQFRPQGDKNNTTYVESLREEGFDVDESNQGVIGCLVIKEYAPPVIVNEYPYHHYQYPSINHPVYYRNGSTADGWNQIVPMNTAITGVTGAYPISMGISSGGISSSMATLNASPIETVTTASRGYSEINNSINFMETNASLGTGFGDDQSFKTKNTCFTRDDKVEWIAVLNYDTLTNLKKMGVVIEKKAEKQAFPGYNPNGCYIPRNR